MTRVNGGGGGLEAGDAPDLREAMLQCKAVLLWNDESSLSGQRPTTPSLSTGR
jgi:hypothetical protein